MRQRSERSFAVPDVYQTGNVLPDLRPDFNSDETIVMSLCIRVNCIASRSGSNNLRHESRIGYRNPGPRRRETGVGAGSYVYPARTGLVRQCKRAGKRSPGLQDNGIAGTAVFIAVWQLPPAFTTLVLPGGGEYVVSYRVWRKVARR